MMVAYLAIMGSILVSFELLEQKGVPSKIEVLARELSITEEEYEFFERRLKAMARDGTLLHRHLHSSIPRQ